MVRFGLILRKKNLLKQWLDFRDKQRLKLWLDSL